MDEAGASIRVEVCVALPGRAIRLPLELRPGATVGDAVAAAMASGAGPALRDALGAHGAAVAGVFGKVAAATRALADGDRVELYRPLAADPKLARQRRVERRRAAEGRSRWRPAG